MAWGWGEGGRRPALRELRAAGLLREAQRLLQRVELLALVHGLQRPAPLGEVGVGGLDPLALGLRGGGGGCGRRRGRNAWWGGLVTTAI